MEIIVEVTRNVRVRGALLDNLSKIQILAKLVKRWDQHLECLLLTEQFSTKFLKGMKLESVWSKVKMR